MIGKSFLIAGFVGVIAVVFGLVFFYGSAADTDAAAESRNLHRDDLEPPSLGGGAYAEWAASGSDIIADANGSPVSDVLIHGQPDEKISVEVQVTALIGSLRSVLLKEIVDVAAGQDLVLPVDVTAALGMHELQYAYPTRIRAHAARVLPDGQLGQGQSLGQRFFVAREGAAAHEIYDFESFAAQYPRGITSPAEEEKLEEDLRDSAMGSIILGDEGFIMPPVYTTVLEQ